VCLTKVCLTFCTPKLHSYSNATLCVGRWLLPGNPVLLPLLGAQCLLYVADIDGAHSQFAAKNNC
jgi:hypothetical protein